MTTEKLDEAHTNEAPMVPTPAAVAEVQRMLQPVLGERLVSRGQVDFGAAASAIFGQVGIPPAAVARPRTATEIAAVVRAAGETGIPFAVRGGGHSYARHSSVADGLVLDLRLLGGAEIGAASRVGTAFAGTTAGTYTALAAESGLATGFGDTLTVGVPGLALGGGIGFLSRRDGLTLDNLLAAEVVLADGSQVRASETENAELFWALRGGGGNFGVVTRLDLKLSELTGVVGGLMAFEPNAATIPRLLAAAAEAPDELSLMVNAMKAPPAPFLPAELHGKPIIVAILCYSGDPERADVVLAPFRSAGTVLTDLVRPQTYSAMFALAPDQAGTFPAQRTGFVDSVDGAQVESVLDAIAHAPTPIAVLNLRPMGGAIGRVSADATAFAHRDRRIMATFGAVDRDPVRAAAGSEWVEASASLIGLDRGSAYVNFLTETSEQATASAYPDATLRRLRAVKSAVDPQNLFRSNHNITPS